MKYLSDYMQDAQTKLFEETGSFFAFGDKQFAESKVDGVKYTQLGAGLLCPVENAAKVQNNLDSIYTEGIKQDLAENGVKKIIWRELSNHECQISYDYTEVIDILKDYGITADDIEKEWHNYYAHCEEHNYF